MIKYVKEIKANIDNITSLMIADIDTDRMELKQQVEEALKILANQTLIQKNGDIYVFLTNEEQEINREIDSQNVEMAEVISKVSELIYDDIFKGDKYRYQPLMADIILLSIDSWMTGYKSNQSHDIGIRVLTERRL